MQRWVYYDYMGTFNPVCEDAGEITRVHPNWPMAPYSHGLIDYIVADGVRFGGDMKRDVFETGGILPFKALRERPGEIVFLPFPSGLRHGDAMPPPYPDPYTVYINASTDEFMTPICTDPRVMYIAHRGYELVGKMVEEGRHDDLVRRWCEDIPTRQSNLLFTSSGSGSPLFPFQSTLLGFSSHHAIYSSTLMFDIFLFRAAFVYRRLPGRLANSNPSIPDKTLPGSLCISSADMT